MSLRVLSLALLALLVGGCSTVRATPPDSATDRLQPTARPAAKQTVYWTFFGGLHQANPMLQSANAPLTSSSKVKDINGTSHNMLVNVCCVRTYKNFVWVLTGPNGSGSANELLIFRSPLKTSDAPLYYDTLTNSDFAVHMTFDAQGNLWVSSLGDKRGSSSVYEYSGDFFMEGATIDPSLTITTGISGPQGLGFDKNGNLYVADANDNAIAVFAQPIQNQEPYYLGGVTDPGGLVFDKHGDLFAFSNAGSAGALVEYKSTDLHSGDKPSVIDSTGIKPNPYGSDLQFDTGGNLYDADCGSYPGIYTYPLATQKLTPKLEPSLYTNSVITQFGCAWNVTL